MRSFTIMYACRFQRSLRNSCHLQVLRSGNRRLKVTFQLDIELEELILICQCRIEAS